jgi:outer membrane lipoprotein carrier protein
MRLVLAVSLLAAAVFADGARSQVLSQGSTPADLAQALQSRYDRVKDFSADFVHRYRGGALRREAVERGTLLIKKPGKMRWEYTAPEQKLFVSDGLKIYSYLPQDKQVLVSSVPDDASAPTPALFLAGKGNLTRDFDVSFTELPTDMATDSRAIKLVPKTKQAEYDWLVLAVDAKTLVLRGLVAIDLQGGTSSFTFTNLKENVGLADNRFVFETPRGVDVVTDTQRR